MDPERRARGIHIQPNYHRHDSRPECTKRRRGKSDRPKCKGRSRRCSVLPDPHVRHRVVNETWSWMDGVPCFGGVARRRCLEPRLREVRNVGGKGRGWIESEGKLARGPTSTWQLFRSFNSRLCQFSASLSFRRGKQAFIVAHFTCNQMCIHCLNFSIEK